MNKLVEELPLWVFVGLLAVGSVCVITAGWYIELMIRAL